MGYKLYKVNLFTSLASTEQRARLTNGVTVDRPYRSDVVVENYTKGTALTAQDLTSTSNQLTVNVIKAALMYVDKLVGTVHDKLLKLLETLDKPSVLAY